MDTAPDHRRHGHRILYSMYRVVGVASSSKLRGCVTVKGPNHNAMYSIIVNPHVWHHLPSVVLLMCGIRI